MSYHPDNVFAKILRDDLPAARVFEDERTLAFMDVMPQSVGHTLIIPKERVENLFEISPTSLDAVIATTQRIALAVRAAFEPAGIEIMQLNGTAAGQTVPHLHFHVIPRYLDSDLGRHAREVADRALLEQHAATIRAALT